MNTNIQTEEELVLPETKKFGIGKWLACYGIAMLCILVIVYAFSGVLADIFSNWPWFVTQFQDIFDTESGKITRLQIISVVGIVFLLFFGASTIGDSWRTRAVDEIGTGVTNFPNIFADSNFKKGPILLRKQYRELYAQYHVNKRYLEDARSNNENLIKNVHFLKRKLIVLLRHHDNASRLISSLSFSMKHHQNFIDKMLDNTLSECVTILEKDYSDKSISLFEIEGDELRIRNYSRISTKTAERKRFKKGEGFAGSIWEQNNASFINKIDHENDIRFYKKPRFKSIMGVPLAIEQDIYGVLCLQSEREEGFCDDDLRAVQFYANICTFLLLYDTIEKSQVLGGDLDG